jgi:hypothetical protein
MFVVSGSAFNVIIFSSEQPQVGGHHGPFSSSFALDDTATLSYVPLDLRHVPLISFS